VPLAAAPPTEFETWHATLTLREQRIDEVRMMMAQGQWMTGASHRRLAEKWGVTPGTVEHIALEANRLLRFGFRTDKAGRDDALALIRHTFEVIRVRALINGTPQGLGVALNATEALARYLGLEPPKRVQVEDHDEFEGKSDEELERIALGGAGDATGGEPTDDRSASDATH
jgi:hypothetical protein